MRKRKNIEDASADGKLAGFVNKVFPVESVFVQHICHKIQRDLLPYLQLQRVFGQNFLPDDLFCQCFGVSNDDCFFVG